MTAAALEIDAAAAASEGERRRRLVCELPVDHGWECFDEHDSGIRLPKAGIEALVAAVSDLTAVPTWTVLLEGHCAGEPHENDGLRESISEEAADLCREQLLKAGVLNPIVCEGVGCASGLGMRVLLSLVPPPVVAQSMPPADCKEASIATTPLSAAETMGGGAELAETTGVGDGSGAADVEASQGTNEPASEPPPVQRVPSVGSTPQRVPSVGSTPQRVPSVGSTPPRVPSVGSAGAAAAGPTPVVATTPLAETLGATTLAETIGSGSAGDLAETVNGADVNAGDARSSSGESSVANDVPSVAPAVAEAAGAAVRVALAGTSGPAAPVRASEDGAKPKTDDMWSKVLNGIGGAAEGRNLASLDVPCEEAATPLPPPDLEGLSDAAQLALLEERLQALAPNGIAFDANSSIVNDRSRSLVRSIAELLKGFPRLGVQCAGHAKGKPSDNNLAKRVLSQDRAACVRDSLLAEGAPNAFACVGFGSALGRGNVVRLHGMLPGDVEHEDAPLRILGWNTGGMSVEQEKASLDQLLREALDSLAFEPNKPALAKGVSDRVVRQVGWILQAFPTWTIRCEGHAKGDPADNSDGKVRLSQARAEVLAAALRSAGVSNLITCVGHGCAQGVGMCVRMFGEDPHGDIEVPDLTALTSEERRIVLDGLLAKVSERGINFEPNSHDLLARELGAVRTLARILRAFPDVVVLIEGHAKGKSGDDNEAKRKLSQARAEAVRAAVRLEGATNTIVCVGKGSALGAGAGLHVRVADPEDVQARQFVIPSTDGLSRDEQESLLNKLLDEALHGNIEFEPNAHVVPRSAMETVRHLAQILNAFPAFAVKCEGHAKGAPSDNNSAKTKLSYLRAEALKAAIVAEGVRSTIQCVGRGSAEGRGMRVRMFAFDPAEEEKQIRVQVPEATASLSREERRLLLNELLAKALEEPITFEPNSVQLEVTVADTIREIAGVLKAFPGFRVVCEGHTKGSPESNTIMKLRLSKARAESVRDALVAQGVETEIACDGKGSSQGAGMCVKLFALPEGGDDGRQSR